ncbi:hypothetical protein KR100_04035 [Synechococcus sp. KORDI-100]|nr:hypothetical protein KR100_04035 [Synechococcus sp. KORDI-100]
MAAVGQGIKTVLGLPKLSMSIQCYREIKGQVFNIYGALIGNI